MRPVSTWLRSAYLRDQEVHQARSRSAEQKREEYDKAADVEREREVVAVAPLACLDRATGEELRHVDSTDLGLRKSLSRRVPKDNAQ